MRHHQRHTDENDQKIETKLKRLRMMSFQSPDILENRELGSQKKKKRSVFAKERDKMSL